MKEHQAIKVRERIRKRGALMLCDNAHCKGAKKPFRAVTQSKPAPGGDGKIFYYVCRYCGKHHELTWITAKGLSLAAELDDAVRRGNFAIIERVMPLYQAEVKQCG